MAISSRLSSSDPADGSSTREQLLAGEQVVFVGKLTSMSRPEAYQLVKQHGAALVSADSGAATLIVLGDNYSDLDHALESDSVAPGLLREEVAAGRAQLLRESELWQRVGLVADPEDVGQGVNRLYTPAMLAELLDVPVAAIRRWHRQSVLIACRSVRRLPYFDFTEVAVARHLAALLKAGCSLHVIDRKLAQLKRWMPDVERPLLDPSIVISGRCMYRRRGDDLTEPDGQLLIDFDKPSESDDSGVQLLSISNAGASTSSDETESDHSLSTLEILQQEASQWEDQGELERAVETYRTMLVAGGPTAELHFSLADLLYRMGDLSAARERFYAAVELDEEYVEARANLGCILAENGELELAVAAFQGALAFHADYADVHYHLANVLERLGRPEEAELHWRTFLALAPENPWAENARTRLEVRESQPTAAADPPT